MVRRMVLGIFFSGFLIKPQQLSFQWLAPLRFTSAVR